VADASPGYVVSSLRPITVQVRAATGYELLATRRGTGGTLKQDGPSVPHEPRIEGPTSPSGRVESRNGSLTKRKAVRNNTQCPGGARYLLRSLDAPGVADGGVGQQMSGR
jgi:hypothetical protein